MTRPKADTDPWLTDPVSRDRVIAKTVVEGFRQIILLLRGIREDALEENRQLRHENAQLRDDLMEMYRTRTTPMPPPIRHTDLALCLTTGCALPEGHPGNHRGSIRRTS